MDNKHLTPLAILCAGALVGGGVYARPVEAPAAPAAPSETRPVTATPVAAVGAPVAGADPRARRAQAQREAALALAASKPGLVEACWAPALAVAAQPASTEYVLQLHFDARGREIARAVGERRGRSRADVGRCLRRQPIGLTIAPPGAVTRVELPLAFP